MLFISYIIFLSFFIFMSWQKARTKGITPNEFANGAVIYSIGWVVLIVIIKLCGI